MNLKFKGVLIGLLLLVLGFFASACKLSGDDTAAPAVPEITASSSPSSSARPPAAANGVPAKDVQVQTNDDKLDFVPPADGDDITDGDTRDNESMPSLHALLPDCGVFINWQDAVNCVNKQKKPHDAQWYIDGFNARTDITHGTTWDDVIKMAQAKVPSDVEVRVIQVYGWTEKEKSKAEAQRAVAPLVGEETASKMEVLYYNVDAFANTWRTKGDKPAMQTFADYNREIRVTLAPLVLNPDGSVAGLLEGVPWGIFVDCYNIHGFFKVVPKKPGTPLLCPPGTPNAGQPMGSVNSCYPPGQQPPPPTCKYPPCSPPPPQSGKDTQNDPQVVGSNKPGHNGGHPPQSDPIGSPGGGTTPDTYVPQPAPQPPTTPRPSDPPPVETPAPQPSNPAPPGDPCKENPDLC